MYYRLQYRCALRDNSEMFRKEYVIWCVPLFFVCKLSSVFCSCSQFFSSVMADVFDEVLAAKQWREGERLLKKRNIAMQEVEHDSKRLDRAAEPEEADDILASMKKKKRKVAKMDAMLALNGFNEDWFYQQ